MLRNVHQMQRTSTAHPIDLMVVGGGVNGGAIAYEAALRGMSVHLVDKGEFAAGASSKSTSLIHGGLRYMIDGQVKMVAHALAERERLAATLAPHLVHPADFFIPVHREGKFGMGSVAFGVTAYDVLKKACAWSKGRNSVFRSPDIYLRRAMQNLGVPFAFDQFRGGFVYPDGRTEDVALTYAFLQSAESRGAVLANRVEVQGFLKKDGKIIGATVKDLDTGSTFEIFARAVVNATGPWAYNLIKMDDPHAENPLELSGGSHIVYPNVFNYLPGKRLPFGIFSEHPADKRLVFVLPYRGKILIGTTDEDFNGNPDEVPAQQLWVDYLLAQANALFPSIQFDRQKVINAFCGLRPLARQRGKSGDALSRMHQVLTGESGLVSLIGGKLTTARSTAEELVDHVLHHMPAERRREFAKSQSTNRPLLGALPIAEFRRFVREEAPRLADEYGVEEHEVRRLMARYGTETADMFERYRNNNPLFFPIWAAAPYLKMELFYAVVYEMATTLTGALDLNLRATRTVGRRKAFYANAAKAMAKYLGWNHDDMEGQIRAFEAYLDASHSHSPD